MVVCWVVCSVDGSIKLQLTGSLPRRSATHECALSCLIPICSIAGREFAETTVIRPSLSMEQLREQARRAAGAQGRLASAQEGIEATAQEGLKHRRYVLVSVHAIRKLNQKGVMFSML